MSTTRKKRDLKKRTKTLEDDLLATNLSKTDSMKISKPRKLTSAKVKLFSIFDGDILKHFKVLIYELYSNIHLRQERTQILPRIPRRAAGGRQPMRSICWSDASTLIQNGAKKLSTISRVTPSSTTCRFINGDGIKRRK